MSKLKKLDEIYYKPLGAKLARAPKGRKGYQGRVERSHGIDNEEFYLPYLLEIKDKDEFLKMAGKWVFWYNTGRPHFGDKMNGKTPYEKLIESGYNLPIEFCAFPPIILDEISTDLVFNFLKRGGNDLCVYDISVLAEEIWDVERVRKIIRDGLEKTRNCVVEIIMKDVRTCRQKVERLTEWVDIAMEEVCRFYGF